MKKTINEQKIFDKFHTYSVKDATPATNDLLQLVKDGVEGSGNDLSPDGMLRAIEYCTYNKGKVMKSHGLSLLLFSGDHEGEGYKLSWAFSRREGEVWGGTVGVKAYGGTVEVTPYPSTLNGEVLND